MLRRALPSGVSDREASGDGKAIEANAEMADGTGIVITASIGVRESATVVIDCAGPTSGAMACAFHGL